MSEDLERLKDRFVRDRDSLIFAQYADLLRKEGHLDEAIEIAERGVMKHPEYATGFLVLGRCYKEKGSPQDAIKQLEIASDLDRQSIIALKELGELHLEQGNKDSAKKVFDKLLALDPLDREVKRMLRRIEEEERAEESGFKEEGLSSYFESKETEEEEVEFEGEPKSSFEDIDIKDLKKVGKAKIGEKEEGGEEIFEQGEKEEAVEEELGEVMEEEGVEGKLEFEAVFGMKEEEEEEERKEEEEVEEEVGFADVFGAEEEEGGEGAEEIFGLEAEEEVAEEGEEGVEEISELEEEEEAMEEGEAEEEEVGEVVGKETEEKVGFAGVFGAEEEEEEIKEAKEEVEDILMVEKGGRSIEEEIAAKEMAGFVSGEERKEKIPEGMKVSAELGDIYRKHGFYDKALKVYEIVYEQKKDERIKEKIEELKGVVGEEGLTMKKSNGEFGDFGILSGEEEKAPIEKEEVDEIEETEKKEDVDENFRDWVDGLSRK